MADWRLYDETAPSEYGKNYPCDANFPFIIVAAEEHLRNELEFWRQQPPSAICLVSPQGEQFTIGIGGPLCGIRWTKPPHKENLKMLLVDPPLVEHGIEFKQQGDVLGFRREHVLAIHDAIPIILHFFRNHCLADWIDWWQWKEPEL